MTQSWNSDAAVQQALCMAASLWHWTGRTLQEPDPDPAEFARRVFEAPFVLVSHGTESDPVLNYGNRTALNLWAMTWEELTRTPSRFTAEAPNRAERAQLLDQVTKHGYIDNYSGVRISKNGRRFRIHQATVWNLITREGNACGQAAMFREWEFLPDNK